jgi:hypothetical protein
MQLRLTNQTETKITIFKVLYIINKLYPIDLLFSRERERERAKIRKNSIQANYYQEEKKLRIL